MAWPQGSRRTGVPQAAAEVLDLRSETHDAGQSGLTGAARGGAAVVGTFIVGRASSSRFSSVILFWELLSEGWP
jgi:hypothetical protein